jgi:[acyl-carrier-protein] S-malonyltransferase/trans-AT polyketide synthase/acyltransferase/oxidoreductase domain-containing protein
MPARSSTSSATTVVFPGQGSQRAGMGRDFCERFASSRLAYEEASEALGLDVAALCFEEDARLALTEYAQPAILTTEIAMLRGLGEAFGLEAVRFGGHSLGEYTALVGAGVLPLAAALRIVRERGRLMQQAVPVGQGCMLAVIGRDLDTGAVERAIAGLAVTIANDNSPEQVVLSGRVDDVAAAERRLAADATLRLVPLDVSAPFHSPLMAGIEPAFAAVLEAPSAGWEASRATAVTSNFTGGFHDADPVALRARLVRQISGRVRWRDNMAVLADGAARIVEIGPGRPLRGFFKAVGVTIESVTDLRSATRAFAAEVAA